MVLRIGFEVPEWRSKPFHEFTLEELLEYWRKMRVTLKTGELGKDPTSSELYTVALQDEIMKRFKDLNKQVEELKEAAWFKKQKVEDLRELVWGEDIPSPTCQEYVEHHCSIQKIMKFIDEEVLK